MVMLRGLPGHAATRLLARLAGFYAALDELGTHLGVLTGLCALGAGFRAGGVGVMSHRTVPGHQGRRQDAERLAIHGRLMDPRETFALRVLVCPANGLERVMSGFVTNPRAVHEGAKMRLVRLTMIVVISPDQTGGGQARRPESDRSHHFATIHRWAPPSGVWSILNMASRA